LHQLEGRVERRKKELLTPPDELFLVSPRGTAAGAEAPFFSASPRKVTASAKTPLVSPAAEAAASAATTAVAAAAATPDATPDAHATATEAAAVEVVMTTEVVQAPVYEPKPLPLLQVCLAQNDPPDQAFVYLWRHRSSSELARDIEQALMDFDALAHECDVLFRECCSAEAEEDGVEESLDRISTVQLHHVTQRLIDFLGSRSPAILERIGHIYGVAASGGGEGIGAVEFRGYVASVLTQVLHELQERSLSPEKEAIVGGPGEDAHQNEPQEEASVFSTLPDSAALLEAMQGWLSSAATAIAGLSEAAVAVGSAEEQPQETKAPAAEGQTQGVEVHRADASLDSTVAAANPAVPECGGVALLATMTAAGSSCRRQS